MIKEYNYYSNGGGGLCKPTLEWIYNIIKNNNIKNIIEFGSGKSTEFLIDVRKELNLNYNIDSFDNDENYCYNGDNHDFLNLQITDLLSCSDSDYNDMFENKVFNNPSDALIVPI